MDIKELKLPLKANEIEWKAQPGKGKTTFLAYIDSRAGYERLDSVVGVNNWKTEFRETQTTFKTKTGIQTEYGYICKLSIKIDNEWVSKEDGSENTQISPLKGGISGAFKRALHQWGVGRELYDYPTIIKNQETWYINWEDKEKLSSIANSIIAGNEKRKYIVLDETQPQKTKPVDTTKAEEELDLAKTEDELKALWNKWSEEGRRVMLPKLKQKKNEIS